MNQALKDRVEDVLGQHAGALPDAVRASLCDALCEIVEGELSNMRERAVAMCVRRGDLWRETSLRGGRLAEEARSRSNEALYLADMLETGQDLADSEPSGSGAAGGGIEARGV